MMSRLTKKILIIDDEGDLIDMLSMRFTSDGFQVASAQDGITGIEKAYENIPNFVFLDISMPGISGWEVCEKLRSDPVFDQTKIIIFTATRDLKPAKKTGADRVILKPFHHDEIMSVLK